MTYPGHNVCHSSAMIAALMMKSAMSRDRELEGGRLYYVFPSHKFQDEGAEKKSSSEEGGSRGFIQESFTVEIKRSKSSPGFAQVIVRVLEASLPGYSNLDLRSMHLTSAQPNLTQCDSWKPRLETINEVGAASRKHIQSVPWFLEVAEIRVWYLWSDGGMENHLCITCLRCSPASQQQPRSNNLSIPSNDECVTTHLPNQLLPKMNGVEDEEEVGAPILPPIHATAQQPLIQP
jgi:hypothetical protein